MSRPNFSPENLGLTRAHIQAFLDSDREPDIVVPDGRTRRGKTRKTPANLRAELKAKGHPDSEIEKTIGDWDSYV